jgi:hypothetical protein
MNPIQSTAGLPTGLYDHSRHGLISHMVAVTGDGRMYEDGETIHDNDVIAAYSRQINSLKLTARQLGVSFDSIRILAND